MRYILLSRTKFASRRSERTTAMITRTEGELAEGTQIDNEQDLVVFASDKSELNLAQAIHLLSCLQEVGKAYFCFCCKVLCSFFFSPCQRDGLDT